MHASTQTRRTRWRKLKHPLSHSPVFAKVDTQAPRICPTPVAAAAHFLRRLLFRTLADARKKPLLHAACSWGSHHHPKRSSSHAKNFLRGAAAGGGTAATLAAKGGLSSILAEASAAERLREFHRNFRPGAPPVPHTHASLFLFPRFPCDG